MGRPARISALLLFVLGAVLMVGGCTSATPPPAPLQIGPKQAGSTQRLAKGQQLQVTLPSNPSTGYRWDVDGALPAQLEQNGQPQFASDSTAIGAGGSEVWTFSAKASGQGALNMKYWRSFESTVPPVQTYSVTVVVK